MRQGVHHSKMAIYPNAKASEGIQYFKNCWRETYRVKSIEIERNLRKEEVEKDLKDYLKGVIEMTSGRDPSDKQVTYVNVKECAMNI